MPERVSPSLKKGIMPIYDLKCPGCGREIEFLGSFEESGKETCTQCPIECGYMERQFSGSIMIKVHGWDPTKLDWESDCRQAGVEY